MKDFFTVDDAIRADEHTSSRLVIGLSDVCDRIIKEGQHVRLKKIKDRYFVVPEGEGGATHYGTLLNIQEIERKPEPEMTLLQAAKNYIRVTEESDVPVMPFAWLDMVQAVDREEEAQNK